MSSYQINLCFFFYSSERFLRAADFVGMCTGGPSQLYSTMSDWYVSVDKEINI